MFSVNQFNQPFNNNNNNNNNNNSYQNYMNVNNNIMNVPNINMNLISNMGMNINMQPNININMQQMNMQNMHIPQMQNYYNPNMQMLNMNSAPVHAPVSVPVPVNTLNINPINLGLNNNDYMLNNQSYYNQLQQQQSAQALQSVTQQQQVAPQPNGGVSEVLDYDIDQMLKFISWLTFGLLKKCSTPSQNFQNNLHSVLSATRLPKSTLLLAINYLSIKMDSQTAPFTVDSEDEIFKTVVILLILANKFNDDKTFRNKSWSDATNLPLAEINEMERTWLKDCDYSLFTSSDYETVENCWNTWCIKNIQSFDSFELSPPQVLNDDFQYITPVSSVPSSPITGSCQFAAYTNNSVIPNQIFENPFQQPQSQNQAFQPISPINDNYYLNDYNNTYSSHPNTSFYGYDYSFNSGLPSYYPASNPVYNFCTASAC